jgi:hypothetical protein
MVGDGGKGGVGRGQGNTTRHDKPRQRQDKAISFEKELVRVIHWRKIHTGAKFIHTAFQQNSYKEYKNLSLWT